MRNRRMRMLTSLVSLALLTPLSPAQDWPQFGGPSGNNTSPETGLAREFPDDGPPVLWTVDVERGYGGASVRDGEVYILDRVLGEKDVLRVLDLETGEELWRFEHEVPGRLMFPGARSVPTVAEELVYVQGGFGQVYCLNRESHEPEWMLDLMEEFDGLLPMFGYSNSPLVVEDVVVVTPLGEETGMLALDRYTGDPWWQTEGLGSTHSTPAVLELLGQEQILMLTSTIDPAVFGGAPPNPDQSQSAPPPGGGMGEGPVDSIVPESMADFQIPGEGMLTSYSPDGEVLWQTDAFYCSTAIPGPIRVDDQHVFLTGGYDAGSVLVRLRQEGTSTKVEEVFRSKRGSQVHLPLLHDDHLYVLVNENRNDPRRRRKEGGLMCIDLDGNEKWRTGNDPYFGRGTMILADGMLIIQDGRNGILRLVDPNPEKYTPIAEANLFGIDDRKDHLMWAPLALAGGRLLMRSQDQLKCVDLRASDS